ncbi:MAG: two-component sensor histidine kinase [Rhodocyclaceae bacterium]|jgi:two-component system OmpR family sensor kinase|nr:two-component sensor histidine kinase [Rhodocyclaceae bacterium]
MNRSLQRQLSLMLGAAILLSGLLAALASFLLAYDETKEFQDDMLRQIAILTLKGSEQLVQPDANDVAINDPESRILVVRIPGNLRPEWLPEHLPTGFHTLNAKGEDLRVFVHEEKLGARIIVAQPTDARNEIAVNSALRTLIPMLLLFPLMIWLIVHIVHREFNPVLKLAHELDAQEADLTNSIDDAGLPNEIKPFVQAINRLLGRVNQLLNQQRRFIADAAHELRSPLTALSLQAQNLGCADSLAAVRERMLPLQAGIERARQLTEQLLNLARTQTGSGGKSIVDISSLARDLIADFLPAAEAKGIDLGLDERAKFSLGATPELLRAIVGNALENAIKYSQPGGVVTLRMDTSGDVGIIEIVDDGPGIPPDEYERVFDAFYRIAGTHEPGSGLGLAIAREAAARLGGTVSLRDREDRSGLIFSYRQSLTR